MRLRFRYVSAFVAGDSCFIIFIISFCHLQAPSYSLCQLQPTRLARSTRGFSFIGYSMLCPNLYMWLYTLVPIPYLQCNKCPALFLKSYQKSLSLSRRWSLNHQRPHLCPFCLLYFPCFHLFVIFCLFSFCLLCLFFVALLIGWVSESVMFSFLAITSTEIYTLVY